MNTELELQEDHGKQQIYIVAFNGENNLLIETETEGETNRWTNALKQHIRFANKVSAQSTGSAPKPAAKSNSITELPTNNQNVATTPVDADDFDSDDDGSFAVESKPATAPTSVNEKDSAASANSSDSQTARAPSPTVESAPSAATESTAETKAPAARRASATASAPAPASASAPTPAPVSKAAKVEKPSKGETASADLTTIDGVATHIMTFFQRVSNDKAYRNALAESVVPRVQSIGQGLSTHFFEGNPGERGEEFILSALAIFLMVLLGLGQLLILLVGWFIFLLAPFLVISGMLMVGSALWELDALASLWLLPNTSVANKKHKVVDSGVFGVVRHPMYGGLVLWVLGWAIFSNSVVKMVLSLVALVLLVGECARAASYV